MSEQKLRELVEKKIPGLVYIIAVFAMIEFGILVACMVTAANHTRVTVYDPDQTVVYQDVFLPGEKTSGKPDPESRGFDFQETRFEKLFSTLGQLNIYLLGATVIVAAFLFWMVPDRLAIEARQADH